MARSLLVSVAIAAAVPASAAVEIVHTPPACVPADRYLRVTARGAAGEGVAGAELQFRAAGTDWYGVRMTADAGAWSAYLPRPTGRLERIEYRIAMTGADSSSASSGPHAVPVAADCPGVESTAEVPSPILVRVPKDAPVVPPVPVGFSPAGVLLANAPPPKKASKLKGAALIAGGAAIAGGAVVATQGGENGETATVPTFDYFSNFITPSANFITLGTSAISVVFTVRGGPMVSLTATWRLDLLRGSEVCAFTAGVTDIAATRPVGVFFSAPVQATGACGSDFEVQNGRFSIVVEGRVLFDSTLPFAYRAVTP
jgi:hypothetical protein